MAIAVAFGSAIRVYMTTVVLEVGFEPTKPYGKSL